MPADLPLTGWVTLGNPLSLYVESGLNASDKQTPLFTAVPPGPRTVPNTMGADRRNLGLNLHFATYKRMTSKK